MSRVAPVAAVLLLALVVVGALVPGRVPATPTPSAIGPDRQAPGQPVPIEPHPAPKRVDDPLVDATAGIEPGWYHDRQVVNRILDERHRSSVVVELRRNDEALLLYPSGGEGKRSERIPGLTLAQLRARLLDVDDRRRGWIILPIGEGVSAFVRGVADQFRELGWHAVIIESPRGDGVAILEVIADRR